MSPWTRFLLRTFPLPLILIGALSLYFGVRSLYRARESVSWPTVDGRIQNSTVERYRGPNGDMDQAEILYTFTVAGQTHSGDTVAFGGCSGDAQCIVNRYPKGKIVSVHYRATDPDVCVLEPGIQGGEAWFLPGLGLVFLIAGTPLTVILFLATRTKKAPNAAIRAMR